jgi:hypothetical protein
VVVVVVMEVFLIPPAPEEQVVAVVQAVVKVVIHLVITLPPQVEQEGLLVLRGPMVQVVSLRQALVVEEFFPVQEVRVLVRVAAPQQQVVVVQAGEGVLVQEFNRHLKVFVL